MTSLDFYKETERDEKEIHFDKNGNEMKITIQHVNHILDIHNIEVFNLSIEQIQELKKFINDNY